MNVDIFTTPRRNTHLAVPSGNSVPSGGTVLPWKTLVLEPDQPRIGMDVRKVIADIDRQGWSVIGAKVEVDIVG